MPEIVSMKSIERYFNFNKLSPIKQNHNLNLIYFISPFSLIHFHCFKTRFSNKKSNACFGNKTFSKNN